MGLQFKYSSSCQSIWLISTVVFITASPLFDNVIKIIFTAFFILAILMQNWKGVRIKRRDVLVLTVIYLILVPYAAVLDQLNAYSIDLIGGGFFVSILLAFVLACSVSKDELLLANERLVFWSLVLGLPVYAALQYNAALLDYALNYTYGAWSHKTFLVLNVLQVGDYTINRFVGFGREPGEMQVFYLLALWFRLKTNSAKVDLPVILIVVGITLGQSTAGFFAMFIVFFLSMPFRKLLKYSLIFSPLILYFLVDQWMYHFEHKLIGSASFAGRYERYLDFFSGDLSKTLFGYGNAYYIQVIAAEGLGGWDTLLQLSQRYGLVFFILLVSLLFYNNKHTPVIAVIISMAFVSQSVWFYPVIAFFYFKGRPSFVFSKPEEGVVVNNFQRIES